jgi:hypothetical protein
MNMAIKQSGCREMRKTVVSETVWQSMVKNLSDQRLAAFYRKATRKQPGNLTRNQMWVELRSLVDVVKM